MEWIQKNILQLIMVAAAGAVVTGSIAMKAPQPTQPTSTPMPGVVSGSQTPEFSASPVPDDIVRLAWFYKPPDDTQLNQVADEADFFILTHKDEPTRSEMKAQGITAPFSQYLLLAEIHDPGNCEDGPFGNQVAYKEGDFCAISEQHPEWFLLDENGNRIGTEDTYFMDPGNEGYRAFWLQRARELMETYGWETIFLDNVEASRTKMLKANAPPANYPDDESYQGAVEGFLEYLQQNYFEAEDKPLYANIVSVDDDAIWNQYLHHLDGVMIESFASDWDRGYLSGNDWEEQLEQAEQALAQGKTLILVAQGKKENVQLQNFAFASYLLIADGNAYFRYTNSDSYREWWDYDNYDLDLGAPLGERYEEKGTWRRDFENGYVIVIPQKRQAEVVINP